MVALRRARPGDLDAFRSFISRLSATTSYRRFFTPVRRISPTHARRLLRSGPTDGAWLSWDSGSVIGHGSWTAVRPATAELALVVEDRFQGRGIGRALATAVLSDAIAAGVRHLELIVQRDNQLIIDLIRRTWPQPRIGVEDGLLVARVALGTDRTGPTTTAVDA